MSYNIKKGKSQIGNLIPDHKCLKIRGQMRSDWGMLYADGIFFEGYKILPSHSQNKLDLRNI
jgi:hypothetical protein